MSQLLSSGGRGNAHLEYLLKLLPSSWALTIAQSNHIPKPGLTDARDGANPLLTPSGSPQATETGFVQRLHTACAAAMHKLTRVLYPNTAALSDLPSIAAKC